MSRDPYEEVICDPCVNCHAEPGDRCKNALTNCEARCPCVARCRKDKAQQTTKDRYY